MKLCFLVLTLAATAAQAALELPALFSDHAVLQRAQTVPVWGWAEAGQEVAVSVAGQTVKATADASGKWRVDLAKLEVAEPQTLTVTAGSETKTIQDVLVGEVWLGSGQSNMAMTVNRAKDYEKEQAAANFPQLRMFVEKSSAAASAQAKAQGTWVICTPDTVGGFSATAYFFGREIHQAMKVPVGLINSSVGGTPIESWISPEAQASDPTLKPFFEAQQKAAAAFDPVKAKEAFEKQLARWKAVAKKAKAEGKPAPRAPRDPLVTRQRKGSIGGLFNGKIAPLVPYAIRGAIWYQGEANSAPEKAPFYQTQLTLLARDWRTRWGYEFPFAWVQLPNYTSSRAEGWMRVREAMMKSLQTVPNSGMAVTLDIGEARDIHPKNKQEVGRRLSLWALGSVYGKGTASQPLLVKHEVKEGSLAVTLSEKVQYKKAEAGSGFVIAGADKVWHPAEVEAKGDTLILSSKAVTTPVAARYAWEQMPAVTLWNSQDVPVTQFRTDDW